MIVPFDAPSTVRAAEILRAGGLVAFPTETVYGLGARADDADAVKRIYQAKGRPSTNPSIVHASTAEAAFGLASSIPVLARRLAEAFWPGPLTMVLTALAGVVAPEALAHGSTIALRVPRHPAARALLEAVDLPLAAPSANRSSGVSPTTAMHVERSLGSAVDLVLDAGPTGFGIESTIVDLSTNAPILLRRGSISLAQLIALGVPVIDVADEVIDPADVAKAPGRFARHYAPDARLSISPRDLIARGVSAELSRGGVVGAIFVGESTPAMASLAKVRIEELPDDAEGFARELYAALHRLDEQRCAVILVEEPPRDERWAAVRDRLTRAARSATD